MTNTATDMETKRVQASAPAATENHELNSRDSNSAHASGTRETYETKQDRVNTNLQLFLLISCLFGGVFVMALDATIIGTAVPRITTEFNSLDDIAWYGSGYLVTITAFQPTFGKIYQFMNIKVVFMACVVTFEGNYLLDQSAYKYIPG